MRQQPSRNLGSRRERAKKHARLARWNASGLTMGSANVRGLNEEKLEMLHSRLDWDVLCLQETWLDPGARPLACPGYQVVEERRQTGPQGGIAVLVRAGLNIER